MGPPPPASQAPPPEGGGLWAWGPFRGLGRYLVKGSPTGLPRPSRSERERQRTNDESGAHPSICRSEECTSCAGGGLLGGATYWGPLRPLRGHLPLKGEDPVKGLQPVSLDRVVRSVSVSEQSDESGIWCPASICRPPSPSIPDPTAGPGPGTGLRTLRTIVCWHRARTGGPGGRTERSE